jgi:hypothetical protein
MRTVAVLALAAALIAVAGDATAVAKRRARCVPAQRILGRSFPRQCGHKVVPRPSVATSPTGQVGLREALRTFSLAIGPLPGVRVRRGATVPFQSGTGPLRWLIAHLGELTPAQHEAALTLLAGPPPAQGAHVAGPAEAAAWKALFDEAADRVAGHLGRPLGIPTTVTLADKQPPGAPDEGAVTAARAPDGSDSGPVTGSCAYTVFPLGRKETAAIQKRIAAHEAFHCFQMEAMGIDAWALAPDWLMEGSAEWAGDTIADEWVGSRGSDFWWDDYLRVPQKPFLERTYDALGWYAHLAENGVDPWSEIPALLANPGSDGTYEGGYDAAMSKAGDFLDSWASSVVRSPTLGLAWDTTGPSLTSAHYRPLRASLGNGNSFSDSLPDEASDVQALDISAEVIEVQPPAGGGITHGRIEFAGGSEKALTPGDYCTRRGGCTCPEGSPGAGSEPEDVGAGETAVAFSVHHSATRLTIKGVSLADWCAKGPRSSVLTDAGPGIRFGRAGACGPDGFGGFKVVLDSQAAGKTWLLQIAIPSESYAGPGTYEVRGDDGAVNSRPDVQVTDGLGLANTWDSNDLGGGTVAGAVSIAADGSGSLSVSMAQHGGGGLASASGTWGCTRS